MDMNLGSVPASTFDVPPGHAGETPACPGLRRGPNSFP